MELTTGYICLSTSSNSEDDFRILDQINRELILCRGVTQEDIGKKSVVYYHYEVAKQEMQ